MDQIIKNKHRIKEMHGDDGFLIKYTFKELCDMDDMKYLLTPIFQSSPDDDRVDEMIDAYNKNPQFLLSKLILTVAIIKGVDGNEYYLMDGQHRLAMCRKLYEIYQYNNNMYVAFYKIANESQFSELFEELNKDSQKNKKYVRMETFKKIIHNQLKASILRKYKDCYAKGKTKQNCLYTVDEFIELLNRNNFLDQQKSIDDMINIIDDRHRIFFNKIEYLEDCNDTHFFKTEIDNINKWRNVIFFKNNNFVSYVCNTNTKPEHFYRNVRSGIGSVLKKKVWEKEFKTKTVGTCPINHCENKLHCDEKYGFQCGHIISVKNGGETTCENLRPICSQCNLCMGTVDWENYEYDKNKNAMWSKKFGEIKIGKCDSCKIKIRKNECDYVKNNNIMAPKLLCKKCVENNILSDNDSDDLKNNSTSTNSDMEYLSHVRDSDSSDDNVPANIIKNNIKVVKKTKILKDDAIARVGIKTAIVRKVITRKNN